MLAYALRSLLVRRRRLLGAVASITLGTALLTGTLVLRDSVQVDLDRIFDRAYTGIDAAVEGPRTIGSPVAAQSRPVEAALADSLRHLSEVRTASPQIEGLAQLEGRDGDALGTIGAPTVGVSWVDEPALRTWRLTQGRAPQRRGEVVIDAQTASSSGLGVGDASTVLVPDPLGVRVVGIAEFAGGTVPGGATTTFFSRADAETHLADGPDQATRILVKSEPGTSRARLTAALQRAVPAGAVVLDRSELVERAAASTGDTSLELLTSLLLAFAAVSLVVAVIGIHTTFSITVAQRTREIALIRTLGASRLQLLASVVTEGAVIGVAASLVGLAVGVLLTIVARSALGVTGLELYSGAPQVKLPTLAIALVVGVAGTLLAALPPAVRAARVAPIQAFGEAELEVRVPAWRVVAGALVLLGGVTLTLIGGADVADPFVPVGLGAIGVLAGVVALGPAVARPASTVLGAPLVRVLGFTGRLAQHNAERNPRRTAASASALLIGLSVVAMLAVVEESTRSSIERISTEAFKADLVALSAGFSGSGLSPELDGALETSPEVAAAVGVGLGAGRIDGEERVFTVADPGRLASVLTLDVRAGALQTMGGDGIAVSTENAEEAGWTLGSDVRVEFIDGTSTDLRVAAIYQSHIGDAVGTSIIPETVWMRHAHQRSNTALFIDLADGVSTAAGKAAVRGVTAEYGSPPVLDQADYVQRQLGGIRQLLAIVYAMLGLSVVIAAMGISNTLSLSVHERIRELGILRALGQSRRQTRTMIRAEAAIISLLGTMGGLGVGTLVGRGVMVALSGQTGVETLVVPYGEFALIAVLGSVIGLASAARPARRAAAVSPMVAIATD